MKKTALVLALGSAFAGAALAQSSVTIYGVADVGVARAPVFDGNTTAATTQGKVNQTVVQSGQTSGSRLGFRGTEDLGNGLSAVFTLEQRVEFDNGGSSNSSQTTNGTVGTGGLQFERQIFAGISSKQAGALTFGRQYTPQFDIQVKTEPLGYGTFGSFTSAGFGLQASRASNSLKYVSPSFSGVQARLQYSFGGSGLAFAGSAQNELAPSSTAGATVEKTGDKMLGLGLSYEGNGIVAGYTYTKSYAGAVGAAVANPGTTVNNVTVAAAPAGLVANPAYTSATGAETWNNFNFSYDFKVAKVFANYSGIKNDISSNLYLVTTTATNAAPNNSTRARGDRNIINAGVSVPFGANKVTLSYSKFNDKGYLDQDASLWGALYEYTLSKRTNVYVQAARISNKNSAVWGFGGAGYSASNLSSNGGESGTAYGVGLRHTF